MERKKWERQILPEQFSSKIPDYMYTQMWQLFLDILDSTKTFLNGMYLIEVDN